MNPIASTRRKSNSARRTLTEKTVAQLRQKIAASGLKPGDQFATESDLESELKVSRPILREAVSRLRALGILESRQCVGVIIAEPDPVSLFAHTLDGSILTSIQLRHLAELRFAMEIGAVELAVKRATDEQLAKLSKLAKEMAAKPKPRAADELELEFHRTILDASHSPALRQMHHVLVAFFARSAKEDVRWLGDEIPEKSAWEHIAIAEAFAQRNIERARALLSGHLAMHVLDANSTNDSTQ